LEAYICQNLTNNLGFKIFLLTREPRELPVFSGHEAITNRLAMSNNGPVQFLAAWGVRVVPLSEIAFGGLNLGQVAQNLKIWDLEYFHSKNALGWP
jgi:hypothetical protein